MKLLHAAFIVGLVGVVSWDAQALKVNATASVEIVEPTGFSQENDFGQFNIDTSDSLFQKIFGSNGSKGEYVRKMPESEYRISGSRNNAIQIEVASQSAQESKVKIDDFVVSYSNGADIGDNNGIVKSAPGRDAKLKLGATIKVKGDAESGYYEPDFNIAIYYE